MRLFTLHTLVNPDSSWRKWIQFVVYSKAFCKIKYRFQIKNSIYFPKNVDRIEDLSDYILCLVIANPTTWPTRQSNKKLIQKPFKKVLSAWSDLLNDDT